MNERMGELLWQAGGYTKLDGSYSLHESHLQKFAELIVRECADISDASFHNGSAGFLAIKKHFGVE
jgi:hypothetical protein